MLQKVCNEKVFQSKMKHAARYKEYGMKNQFGRKPLATEKIYF